MTEPTGIGQSTGEAEAVSRPVLDTEASWGDGILALLPLPCSSKLIKALTRLHEVNSRQWSTEDQIRSAEDEDIPQFKREIDGLNGLRHELIEETDRTLGPGWPENDSVPPLTESIGSALDRLSVLTLRLAHAEELLDGTAQAQERVAIVRDQRDELVWSIEVACEDLASGRRRPPRPERMKLYGKVGR